MPLQEGMKMRLLETQFNKLPVRFQPEPSLILDPPGSLRKDLLDTVLGWFRQKNNRNNPGRTSRNRVGRSKINSQPNHRSTSD
jgi:hypothetical protein